MGVLIDQISVYLTILLPDINSENTTRKFFDICKIKLCGEFFVIFKKNSGILNHIGFRMKLIERLIEEGGSDSSSRSFVSAKISENVVRLIGRHFPSYVESDCSKKKKKKKKHRENVCMNRSRKQFCHSKINFCFIFKLYYYIDSENNRRPMVAQTQAKLRGNARCDGYDREQHRLDYFSTAKYENLTDKGIKKIRTDNGSEFVNEQLDTYVANSGIYHENNSIQ
ncbi:piggyBac transposable element-derived protein 4 [Trichonephila clavipes]|uniref:PiggyBac transposable element-derived protein 4 n=1 Tax=Trichonephila clavipes TaxID=2585209 RepID=A0A8X6RK35_TRICX|nr:piggyBac transposable element-derived protein 4 [Trichonephila clavipes]